MTSHLRIAQVGQGQFRHRFGGSSWAVVGLEVIPIPAALLLTLDLSDPSLGFAFPHIGNELPLVSYINIDVPPEVQTYRVASSSKQVEYVEPTIGEYNVLPSEVCLPVPLPEKPLDFRTANSREVPADEESYWSAVDSFVGGEGFIRIGGEPLWLQNRERPVDFDGVPMQHGACIGYERYDQPSGIVSPDIPFFIGEMALYFFVSKARPVVTVLLQST